MHFLRLSRLALGCTIVVLAGLVVLGQTGASLTGSVKDPSGAVVPDAEVTLSPAVGASRTAKTDPRGQYRIDNLAAGSYRVRVSRPGFAVAERNVQIVNRQNATIDIDLALEVVATDIDVSSKGSIRANSDPVYRRLRQDVIFETYSVNNLKVTRDAGSLTLKTGRVSFATPVEGRVVSAVFDGDGEFTLTPVLATERNHIRMITGTENVVEAFDKLVITFTDSTYDEIKAQATPAEPDTSAAKLLQDFRKRVRSRPAEPRGILEGLSQNQSMENLDAETLADIYNPGHPGFFMAFISGKRFSDLRFVVRPRGAIQQILSPEEVGLVNYNPEAEREGILYLAHYQQELLSRKATSEEDKRIIHVEHYRIETVIAGEKLTASAEIDFTPVADGDRVVKFGLLPSLRVTRVTFSNAETPYIQEGANQDGAFYAVLPDRLVKGKPYKINIDYEGNKVIADHGGGNFAAGARTSWYPTANSFNDRATFDLTFKVSKLYTLVAVGKEVRNWTEGNFAASQWVSELPLAVAGFNYGRFKKKALVDAPTKYEIEGYAAANLPAAGGGRPVRFDQCAIPAICQGVNRSQMGGAFTAVVSPGSLLDDAIADTQVSMRLFTNWFGEAPYGRIAITQQPQPNFAESWPALVYLPVIALYDGTQRWMLGLNSTAQTQLDGEAAAAAEVSHQWWGHIVGWASYRDQWLSEGFAYFSAGLFLDFTEPKQDKYIAYWRNATERLLEKNRWGQRANDAGPVWMGLRLNTYKTPDAYQRVAYMKGGYVLHMLRAIMWDPKTHDDNFIAMMKDYVKTYANRNASSEGFQLITEKHMTPAMDLDGNHRMDWFFNEWVYGTDVPTYAFQYSITPEKDGKFLLSGSLTQSHVPEEFKMIVPFYVDTGGKIGRIGIVAIQGNETKEFQVHLAKRPRRAMINAYHDVLAVETVREQK